MNRRALHALALLVHAALLGGCVASHATTTTLSRERRLLALDLAENLAASGAQRHAHELQPLVRELREAPVGNGSRP